MCHQTPAQIPKILARILSMLLLFYNCEEKHKNMHISEGLTISIQIQTNSTARSITDSYKYIFRNLKLRPSYPSWMGFGHYEVNFLIAGPRTHPVPDVSNHSCPIDKPMISTPSYSKHSRPRPLP